MNDLTPLVKEAQDQFELATAPADLENAKARFLGKTGRITEQLKALAALPPEEKKRLAEKEAMLNKNVAARDYRMAGYYDRKKDYGAAKHYYTAVVKNFPDTDLGQKSRDRIAEIKGEPESPTKPLGFIVDLLPENRERTFDCLNVVGVGDPQHVPVIALEPRGHVF